MTRVTLHVNGQTITGDIDPRTHLADFLRERHQLTGTHLGCEHGVCGACTLLINGEPARSCITYAVACDQAEITTIEGLADDPATIRLREAFSAHHALQCGYCTPGMMATARDIVLRLPDATDDDIRLELAGNLCRCTGYNGIVRAIRQVLDERLDLPRPDHAPLPMASFGPASIAAATASKPASRSGPGLSQVIAFADPPDRLWRMLRDPQAIISCLPGAKLTEMTGDRITGEMVVSLGPVRARFVGGATLTYDDATRSGLIDGGGQDRTSGTMVSALVPFSVVEAGTGSELRVEVEFSLRGALAQLAKGRVVELVADEITAMFAENLRSVLAGYVAPVAEPLSGFGLAFRLALAWLRRWLGGQR